MVDLLALGVVAGLPRIRRVGVGEPHRAAGSDGFRRPDPEAMARLPAPHTTEPRVPSRPAGNDTSTPIAAPGPERRVVGIAETRRWSTGDA